LIEADLSALEGIFGAISRLEPNVRLGPILEYLRWTLPLELDFIREAEAIGNLRRAIGHRGDVSVPKVVEGLNTRRLLVMELAEGVKITDREALVRAGIDPKRVAETLVDVYAEQIFRCGVLHADPHPGNLLVRPGPDGPVLVLLDHGLTVDVPDSLSASLRGMLLALEEGDLDALTAGLERAGLHLGPEVDLETLLSIVGVLMGGEEAGGQGDVGELGMKLGASVGSIPVELLLMGRAIGLIDGIIRQLDPDLDTVGIVARYARG
ncbi:MAG: AarF/UbiB family protein, partial [Actinomycetota bacterium]|nr:AarF/UbiB family protein [Actinomycetota bacterium]